MNKNVSGHKYSTNTTGSLEASSNDLVISTNQPKGKLIKALFEPSAKLSDSLTYDITAWSLPYAHGLEAIASTRFVNTVNLVTKDKKSLPLENSYGYVSDWNSMQDAKFLSTLLTNNIKVRFNQKPFVQNRTTFERGSLIILQRDNKHIENFVSFLNKIVVEKNQKLTAINTGFSDVLPDMGSSSIKLIRKPTIALISGENTSSLSYGATWHFFEQQLNYPVTSINSEDFDKTKLERFNILIFPSGYYNTVLDKKGMQKLSSYIKSGGKVIAFDRALRTFAGRDGFNLMLNKQTSTTNDSSAKLIPYANRRREYAKNMITGAIFKTKVDNTHPMAYGYSNDYFSLKLGTSSYRLLTKGFNIAHIGDSVEKVSGFAGSETLNLLKNSLVFGEEQIGRGSMIYFVDNVLFRSFWESGKLFFVNSLFFVNN